MRKWIKTILAVLMSALLLCFGLTGCTKDPAGPGGGDDDDDPDTEKKTLLFQIDEGVGNYEFVAGCYGDTGKMDVILNNIYSGIKDLQENYDVCVLIYPNWYYKESGFDGKDPSDGIGKISDSLLYAMDFFEEKKVGVYLEIMSSGIYTNQNGELGRLPIVDINSGLAGKEKRPVKGISLDMHSLVAIKKAYPETLRGLRFHELIGTDELGSNPPDDPFWGNHGYAIFQEDVYQIIDVCAENGLKLVWSDHTFDVMYDASKSFWKTRVEYASAKLGKDLTVMWANNAGEATRYLSLGLLENFKRDFPNSTVGLSNQNWFAIALEQNMQNNYYESEYPECDMPIELLAGFTLKAFDHGATVVQYEPPYQLFNFHRNLYMMGDLGVGNTIDGYQGSTAGYEKSADYSPRLELKRLVKILNDKDDSFTDIENFFDKSSGKISANLSEDAPKVYSQTTLSFIGESGVKYVDKYNNKPASWREESANRFGDWMIGSDVLAAQRIAIGYNDFDDIAVAVKENGKTVAKFYNERSGLLLRDDAIFADNANGTFVGFTTANLVQERVQNTGKDTDEVIVARKKGDKINLSVYKVINNGKYNASVAMSTKISFMEISTANMYLTSFFGGTQIDAANFAGIFGIRSNNSISKVSGKRPTDGLTAVYISGSDVTVTGKKNSTAAKINQKITVDGTPTAVAFGDTDLDTRLSDEFLISVSKNGENTVNFYTFVGNSTLSKLSDSVKLGAFSPTKILQLRKSFYSYDNSI